MDNSTFGAAEIEAGIRTSIRRCGWFVNEAQFQKAVSETFGGPPLCARERSMEFGPPRYLPPAPPPQHGPPIDVCAKKGDRKLDLLFACGSEAVAVELKYSCVPSWHGAYKGKSMVTKGWSDVVTYGFLKELPQRPERAGSKEPVRNNKRYVPPAEHPWKRGVAARASSATPPQPLPRRPGTSGG